MENEEIEKTIVKLAKQGINPAKIGLVLRDRYGIFLPKDMKMKKIFEKYEIDFPSNEDFLKKKIQKIRIHYDKNKQDKVAKRTLQTTESRIAKFKSK